MGASVFLIINAFIVFFLVSWIISFGKSRSRPSIKEDRGGKPQNNFKVEFFDIFSGSKNQSPKEKQLNCPFKFDGENIDAYEVLGVPAGAPREICAMAYRDLVRTANADRRRVIEAAMKTLGF